MGKRVILTLLEGSFEQGFPVILRIGEDGTVADTGIQILGKLPPALNILELFNNWQLAYYHTVMPHSRIRPKPAQVTNFSCHQLGSDLALQMNKWLNSEFREWQKIRDGLQRHLNDNDEIHVVLETEDIALRRLPWHLWNLFSSHYTKAEFVLGAPEHYSSKGRRISRSKKIRILAILGDSTGIDIQKDRAMLEQLPYAKTSFLVEPERQALYNQLWEEQWKIIFFAGHSWSAEDDGSNKIYINRQDSLSIAELKEALRNAIENGLQLAIFNSCNGLGLAQELADLHIPQVIIMREPVPDLVAQEFLKHFLTSFTRGKSLYLAVREARERLQSLERQFPCAAWLPIIYQNPTEVPPTWQELLGRNVRNRQNLILSIAKPLLLLLVSLAPTWLIPPVRNTMLDIILPPLCSANSCIGRDPINNRCDFDRRTIESAVRNAITSAGAIANFQVDLRYSKRCNSTWARTSGNFLISDYLAYDYLEDRTGNIYGKDNVLPGYLDHFGNMGPEDKDIRACVKPLHGEPVCTAFVNPREVY